MSKYHRTIQRNEDGKSDVYDVLSAFNVTNPAVAHAIKKLLMPGARGHKTTIDDISEAKQSIERAVEMFNDECESVRNELVDTATAKWSDHVQESVELMVLGHGGDYHVLDPNETYVTDNNGIPTKLVKTTIFPGFHLLKTPDQDEEDRPNAAD